jgi:ubiquinone/menaquinone biosynthesis C-methylase UbiE
MPDPKLVVDAFTELAPAYEATVDRELRAFWGVSYRDFLARFLAIADIREGQAVLDVATGTAYLPAQIADQVGGQGRIYGLDITPAMLTHGAARLSVNGYHTRTRLVCGSALDVPLAAASIDAALCALGMHHMDAVALIAEMQRVVKPGGILVLADVCANTFWQSPAGSLLVRLLAVGYGLALRSIRTQAEIEAFHNVRSANDWRSLLGAHGFGDIALHEIRPRFPWYPGGFIARAVRT